VTAKRIRLSAIVINRGAFARTRLKRSAERVPLIGKSPLRVDILNR
jgi:hypothetical protein